MALFHYSPETTLEAAVVALLTARGIAARSSRTVDGLKTPYVTVAFELGEEKPVDAPTPTGGISALYDGQFRIAIVTDREANNTEHADLRATVREVMAESTGAEWAAAIGGRYAFGTLRHVLTAYDVLAADEGIDASAMLYAATVQFRQG